MECKDYIVAVVGLLLTLVGVYFAYNAAKYSKGLYSEYIKDRHKDFEKGNRILKIERTGDLADRFEVTIKNENNIKRVGIHKFIIENRDGRVVDLYTLESLNRQPMRYIEACGIEIFVVLPSSHDSFQQINAVPCKFSTIDTNGEKDEVILNSMNRGIIYEVES